MNKENENRFLNQYEIIKEHQKTAMDVKDKLHDLVEERLTLESGPLVRQYISVLEAIKNLPQSAFEELPKEETLFDTFAIHGKTNNIYVYMGSYTYSVPGSGIVEILRDSYIEEGWNEYKDIEKHYSKDDIEVIRTKVKQFETDNIVLFAKSGIDNEDFYKLVRRTFFKYVVEFGQEIAVQKIIEEFGTQEDILKREREKKQ